MMQNFFLLMAVAAIVVFLYFVMKRLDCFLENSRQAQMISQKSTEHILKIGFSNPLVADSLLQVFEKYSLICPDVSVRLFGGTEKELLREFSKGKINVIFLSESGDILEKKHYNIRKVMLNLSPVFTNGIDLPIEPITEEPVLQEVLWLRQEMISAADAFVECLNEVAVKRQE